VAIAPGVTLVEGAAPWRPIALPPSPAPVPGSVFVVGMSALVLLLVGAAGIGWSRTLFRSRLDALQRVAVAPAVGIAALVTGGTLWSRLGGPLRGPGAVAGYAVITAAGMAASLTRRRPPRPAPQVAEPVMASSPR
jgi:hypothetical protein